MTEVAFNPTQVGSAVTITAQRPLTSPWALMVEKDAVDREEIVGLPEIHHYPVGIQLSRP